jgi:transposase
MVLPFSQGLSEGPINERKLSKRLMYGHGKFQSTETASALWIVGRPVLVDGDTGEW